MGLVDYSDSEEEDAAPKSKRRRLSNVRENALPPLPAGFRDLYSSTVRTSTQDDPALHGGRKRVTPHVAGNWPTHVYLDWSPTPKEYELLSNILGEIRKTSTSQNDVQSLLENDLGVQLPLHVSLSRPLALKTNQKDEFVSKLEKAIGEASVRAFEVQPLELVWHPNEHRTRWFLVLRLQRPAGDELKNLLKTCNGLAKSLDQPLLYAEGHNEDSNAFHVSIAWSLKPEGRKGADTGPSPQNVSAESLEKLKAFRVEFSDVKVRIGQDVRTHSLSSTFLANSETASTDMPTLKPQPLLIPSACRHHDCEHGTSPAIAQVNQQIRKEFQDIFYAENTFEYHIHRCDFTYLFEWMGTIESHNRKRICNIRLVLKDRWTCGGGLLDFVRWCAKEKGIEHIVWIVDGALTWSQEHTTYANTFRGAPAALEPDAWVMAMQQTQDALEKALELSHQLAKEHKSSESSIRKAFESWLKDIGFTHELHTYPRCVHKSRKRDAFMQSSAGGFCSVEDRLAGTHDLDISFATAVCYFEDEDLSAMLRN